MDLQPEFLSAAIGDFDEAYTPFMLWNRNNLDLNYKPEMMARADDIYKFEAFYNHEPYWPFRGLRLETALGWPNSDLLDLWKTSAFVHMIQNGFVLNGGNYASPYTSNFTDWIFAGHTEIKSKRWYTGFTSWQAYLDGYGIIMDEPADSNPKLAGGYKPGTSTTWLHQYRLWSVRPALRVGLGDDVYLGVEAEPAFSDFQDDKFNSKSTVSDIALRGGPFLQMGSSKISATYLNVGPHYYSPLAQTRQDYIDPIGGAVFFPIVGPDLFQAPLRSYIANFLPTFPPLPITPFFLPGVTRASDIFGWYDRTADNTFPYGLATPNRQGIGMDMDIKALKNYALKIKGSAYFVNEINGNLVKSASGALTAVDSTDEVTQSGVTLNGVFLTRNFTYLNIGPSFDLGPSLNLTTPFEIGANLRYEQTTSALGTLNSTWILGSLRVGFAPGWEATVAYSERDFSGIDEGYSGQPFARYSYVNDRRDLGVYDPFTVSDSIQAWLMSMTIEMDRNSRLYFDYDLTQGTYFPTNGVVFNWPNTGKMYNQYFQGLYEIKF
jgi:hypothetical protein